MKKALSIKELAIMGGALFSMHFGAACMGNHDSFFLRDGDKLYFSRWYEEGDGADYRYWEETVVRNLNGDVTDVFSGGVRIMPNGEMWNIK